MLYEARLAGSRTVEMYCMNARNGFIERTTAGPGAISHNGVLGLYRNISNLALAGKNFGIEEQNKVLKAERSNCTLDRGRFVFVDKGN